MSKEEEEELTLTYRYPEDCGRFRLYTEKDSALPKPIDECKCKCSYWSDFRSGGHLDMIDSDDSSSSSDTTNSRSDDNCSDSEKSSEEEEYEVFFNIYHKRKWHVYYVDMYGGGINAQLIGLFDERKGAEIFSRILFHCREGCGIYHNDRRVDIEVIGGEDILEDCDIPSYHSDESCGDYLVIVSPKFGLINGQCYFHPFNYCDNWDQIGSTKLDVSIKKESKIVQKEEKKKKARKADALLPKETKKLKQT